MKKKKIFFISMYSMLRVGEILDDCFNYVFGLFNAKIFLLAFLLPLSEDF